MKIPKSVSLYAAIIGVTLLLAVFVLGFFLDNTTFDHTLTLQAPIEKAFENIASHDLKPKIYPNISAEETNIMPFEEGNVSTLCYTTKKLNCFTEEILRIDSLKQLTVKTITPQFSTISTLYFSANYRRTKLHIVEIVTGKSALDRAMLFLFKKPYLEQRAKFYDVLKSAVESTPDYSINPEELK